MISNQVAIKLVECPRDAMQGLIPFIPTKEKAAYINLLLKVGFDTIDFGSFVSSKIIPQMKDTVEVLESLDIDGSSSKLLAIIANQRGAEEALQHKQITYLGFPLSLSEIFQKRNTNKSIEEAFNIVADIQNLCLKQGRQLVTYLSMGFGNPYGDPYSVDYVSEFVSRLNEMGIKIISLSDTIGISDKENITYLFTSLIKEFPQIEFGAHIHTNPTTAKEKIEAAYRSGCRRFDGALKGYGGCPMAKDELIGNLATETLVDYFNSNNISLGIDKTKFAEALTKASLVFPK